MLAIPPCCFLTNKVCTGKTAKFIRVLYLSRSTAVLLYICMLDIWSSCFFTRRSPPAEGFFSHFQPRCKLACHGYIMRACSSSACTRPTHLLYMHIATAKVCRNSMAQPRFSFARYSETQRGGMLSKVNR